MLYDVHMDEVVQIYINFTVFIIGTYLQYKPCMVYVI